VVPTVRITSTHHTADLLTTRCDDLLTGHRTSASTYYNIIPAVPLETRWDMLSAVNILLKSHDRHHWYVNDDNDNSIINKQKSGQLTDMQ